MKNHFEKDNYIFKIFGVSLNLTELFGGNPKFCVKSISGANRSKFIYGGSRLVLLPPW